MKRQLTDKELAQRRQAGIARAKKAGWFGNSVHGRSLQGYHGGKTLARHNPYHLILASRAGVEARRNSEHGQ